MRWFDIVGSCRTAKVSVPLLASWLLSRDVAVHSGVVGAYCISPGTGTRSVCSSSSAGKLKRRGGRDITMRVSEDSRARGRIYS